MTLKGIIEATMVLKSLEGKERDDAERRIQEAARIFEQQRANAEIAASLARFQEETKAAADAAFNHSVEQLEALKKSRIDGQVEKSALLVDKESRTASLTWGSHFSVENGQIEPETGRGGFLGLIRTKEQESQSIKIHIYQTSGVEINNSGETIPNTDLPKVDDALAEAFRNPLKNTTGAMERDKRSPWSDVDPASMGH